MERSVSDQFWEVEVAFRGAEGYVYFWYYLCATAGSLHGCDATDEDEDEIIIETATEIDIETLIEIIVVELLIEIAIEIRIEITIRRIIEIAIGITIDFLSK